MMPDVKPIFIVGPPRTGTTLLARLLGGGEKVLSLSEPFHLDDLLPHWALKYWFRSLLKKSEMVRVPLPRIRNYDEYFSFLKDLAAANQMRYLVMKECFHELELKKPWANFELLDGFAATGHSIIAITRHPSDTIASTLKLLRKLFFGYTGVLIRLMWPSVPRFADDDHVVRWAARNWAHFMEWASDRNLCLVRYEDLVKEPAATLMRLCESVGLPYSERMLDHEHMPPGFGGIGAPEVLFKAPKPVDSSSVGRGKSLAPEHQRTIRALCGIQAAETGYTIECQDGRTATEGTQPQNPLQPLGATSP